MRWCALLAEACRRMAAMGTSSSVDACDAQDARREKEDSLTLSMELVPSLSQSLLEFVGEGERQMEGLLWMISWGPSNE